MFQSKSFLDSNVQQKLKEPYKICQQTYLEGDMVEERTANSKMLPLLVLQKMPLQ